MQKFNRMGLLAACGLAAATAFANNEYTKTVKDGVAEVVGTQNDPLITDTLSGAGIDTIKFTRSGSFGAVKLRSSSGNTHTGGTISDGVMIKIQNPNVLGTGPVWLYNQWAALYVDWCSAEVDVPNKVYFDNSESYVAGQDAYGLALHNIGVTDANTSKLVVIGRTGTGTANLHLALDGDQNDPIGYFALRGNLSLTVDGGTLRAAAGSARDFFAKADANATPRISILNAPLTIDAAAGSPVRFGIAPTFSGVKAVDVFQEEIKPTNWSFETTSGWTFVPGAGGAGGYYQNNSAFDSNNLYPTTNGTHYAMMRRGGSVYQNISFAKAGKYRVVFERGCRGGNYSKGISLTVSIDDTPLTVFPALSAPTGFTQLETDFVNLTAAEHKLSFALSETATDSYGSLNIDAVRLERYETVTPGFEIAKTGAGTFVINDFNQNALSVDVQNGTLACENTVLPNATIAVANGATLNAAGLTAAGAEINVAVGGRVALSPVDSANLVANGSFETPYTADNAFYWASACLWTLYPWEGSARPVIQRNGGTYCPSGNSYPTPYGDQFLLLRIDEAAYQSVSVPEDGTYALSFAQSYRKGYQSPGLTVAVDGNAVLTVSGADAQHDFEQTTVNVVLTKGNHEIRFTAQSGNNAGQYSRLSIDNVSLVDAVVSPCDLSATTLALKSGSIVRLDNPEKAVIGAVTVNGVEVRGGANALRASDLRRWGLRKSGQGRRGAMSAREKNRVCASDHR